MCREAGCAEPDELPQAERAAEAARRLDETLADLDDQLLGLAAGNTIDEFIAQAEAVPADDLPGQLGQLRGQIEDLDTQRTNLSESIGSEEHRLESMQGSTEALDAAEEVQELLARLEGDVEQYARLRLASAVLRAAVERYRQKNEAPVLQRASALFRRLTLGSFERLAADCDEQGEKLLRGLRSGNGTTTVALAGMSEGTCDQLYLALRLASLESYFESHEPMPFIVDDVLVSFDNPLRGGRPGSIGRAFASGAGRVFHAPRPPGRVGSRPSWPWGPLPPHAGQAARPRMSPLSGHPVAVGGRKTGGEGGLVNSPLPLTAARCPERGRG